MSETSNNAIEVKVNDFLKTYTKHDVAYDQDLFKTGLVSSLFAMQLVLFIEKEFNFKIDNQDLDLKNFNSINAITAFIDRKLSSE